MRKAIEARRWIEANGGDPDPPMLAFKEKPDWLGVAVGLACTLIFCFVINTRLTSSVIAYSLSELLSFGGIPNYVEMSWPQLVTYFPDVRPFVLPIDWRYSGFAVLLVFCVLMSFTAFALRGPIWYKVVWLVSGCFLLFAWNLVRLAFSLVLGYYYGLTVFRASYFFFGPLIDFVWVTAIWSFGMSYFRLVRGEVIAS